jgi:hypothetical protein
MSQILAMIVKFVRAAWLGGRLAVRILGREQESRAA